MARKNAITFDLSNVIIGVIILMPIFRYYNLPGTEIGSESLMSLLVFLLSSFVCITNRQRKFENFNKERKTFLLFFLWCFVITSLYIINDNLHGNINNAIVAAIVGCSIINILSGRIRLGDCIRFYELLSRIIIIICVLQIVLATAGIHIDFHIPFHDFNSSWQFSSDKIFGMGEHNTSLFSEPAHYSEFLLPYICYCLFEESKKSGLLWAIIATITIVATVSGTGIMLLTLIWILYYYNKGKFGFKSLLLLIFALSLVMGIFLYLQTMESYQNMFGNLFVGDDGFENNKASYRIYRGWDYVRQMPFPENLFGVGFNNMESFATEHHIYSIFDSKFKMFEWWSGITEILLYFGLIGLVFFIIHTIKLFKGASKASKMVFGVLFSLMFTSQILFLETHFFYVLIGMALKNQISINSKFSRK